MRSVSSCRYRSSKARAVCVVSLLVALLMCAAGAWARGDPRLGLRAVQARRPGPLVAAVHFAGNETFDDETLSHYMQTRASGVVLKTYYDRRTVIRDIENLKRFYASMGFLEADVELEDLGSNADTTAVELLIGVYEGDRWMVDRVTFDGPKNVSEQDLRSVLRVVEGTPLQQGKLPGDRRLILEEYAKRSYLDARVEQVAERDDESRVASISYRIVEREPAVIDSIDVVGDDKTRQFVVERELTFAVGEPFDFTKIGKSQANIYRTGLFNSVWIEPAHEDTGRAEKRVVVRVSERPSGDYNLTLGYATMEHLEVGAGITNRNVQGQATTLGLTGRYSERSWETRASVGDPWFLGRRVAAEAAALYGETGDGDYAAKTWSVGFVLAKKLGLNLTLEGGYQYEWTDVLKAKNESEEGTNDTSDLLFAVIYDSRNDVLSARRGMYARGEVDLAGSGLGGTNDFVRFEFDWRGYAGIRHGRVAAVGVRAGWINPTVGAGEVPPNERYRKEEAQGLVRGFPGSLLVPTDSGDGRGLLVARAEVRFPVYKKLRAAAFVDAGRVFEDLESVNLSGLAVGAGVGVRFDTRIGVLRFDVATPVSEAGSPQYYFGVGQAF